MKNEKALDLGHRPTPGPVRTDMNVVYNRESTELRLFTQTLSGTDVNYNYKGSDGRESTCPIRSRDNHGHLVACAARCPLAFKCVLM